MVKSLGKLEKGTVFENCLYHSRSLLTSQCSICQLRAKQCVPNVNALEFVDLFKIFIASLLTGEPRHRLQSIK